LPFPAVLNGSELKPRAELETLFAELAAKDERVITSCGSGLTACVLTLAAYAAGYRKLSVYDGSWADWGSDAALPVVEQTSSLAFLRWRATSNQASVQFITLYYQNGQPLNARAHGAVCFRERNPERRVSGSARHRVIERSHYWCPKLAADQAPNSDTEPPARKTAQCTSTRCRVLSRAESGTASEREYAASWDRAIQLLVSQTNSCVHTTLVLLVSRTAIYEKRDFISSILRCGIASTSG
jgi:hypothetical protein